LQKSDDSSSPDLTGKSLLEKRDGMTEQQQGKICLQFLKI
jgi:hypothetical protein